jgi:predicted transcriptional regulator of viral defense system
VDDFNTNRRDVLHQGVYQTMDESMSAYKPRKDKLGGLSNITYIHRKSKPLGTEMKTMCDCATGVMVCMEVQEGKNAMRQKNKQPNMECLPRVCYEWRRMQMMKA